MKEKGDAALFAESFDEMITAGHFYQGLSCRILSFVSKSGRSINAPTFEDRVH